MAERWNLTGKGNYRNVLEKARKGLYEAKKADTDRGVVKTERKQEEWCRSCGCLTFTQTEILERIYLGTEMYLRDTGGWNLLLV